MLRAPNVLRAVAGGARSGSLGFLALTLRRRLYSERTYYGLRRDLDAPFEAPEARIPLGIRPLRSDDLEKLLGTQGAGRSARGPFERAQRLDFAAAGIGTCYVAATDGDEPCYMQWLMHAGENESIRRYFKGIFPLLEPDEALLEHAFTREDFQGRGIMAAAMARIAERAREQGASRVITFVEHENVPALKGCRRAGFRPHLVRLDRWRLFRRHVSFRPLPPGARYPFET